MELEHSFTVPVPVDRAWDVLLDVERVAPCMPGATLDSVDGDEIKGRIKVKVGPISMTYAGTARFAERDERSRVVTLQAAGKETRGAGTASATVRSVLASQGEATRVTVHTTLSVTGKPAQFGRGVMAEVGGKLIGIFAANLAGMLSAADGPATADGLAAVPAAAGSDRADPGQYSAEPAGPDQPVETLNLPARTYNSLHRDGVLTIADLAARTPQELLAIANIGPASVEDIRRRLADLGLTLGERSAAPVGIAAANGSPADVSPADSGPAGPVPLSSVPAGVTSAGAAAGADSPWALRPADDDAIDLLSVAGLPVLKRLAPVLAGLLAVVLVLLGARARKQRRRG